MITNHPPGPPMTLGNMREAGPAHLPDDLLAADAQLVIIARLEN